MNGSHGTFKILGLLNKITKTKLNKSKRVKFKTNIFMESLVENILI